MNLLMDLLAVFVSLFLVRSLPTIRTAVFQNGLISSYNLLSALSFLKHPKVKFLLWLVLLLTLFILLQYWWYRYYPILLWGFKVLLLSLMLIEMGTAPLIKIKSFIQNATLDSELLIFMQLFAMLFWFFVLGIVGALIYFVFLTCFFQKEQTPGQFLSTLSDILNWVPTKLAILGFAFMGNFNSVWQVNCQNWLHHPRDNEKILEQAFVASEISHIILCLIFWLVVVAFYSLSLTLYSSSF